MALWEALYAAAGALEAGAMAVPALALALDAIGLSVGLDWDFSGDALDSPLAIGVSIGLHAFAIAAAGAASLLR